MITEIEEKSKLTIFDPLDHDLIECYYDFTAVEIEKTKNFEEEFNVIIIQENTPALYDENGDAYSDWDRSELVVTTKEGVPVSVKK